MQDLNNNFRYNQGIDNPYFVNSTNDLAFWKLKIKNDITMKERIDKISSKKEKVRIDLYRKLDVAVKYIESNLCSKIHIKSVARHCGMSEYHFSRTFKEAFGISPYLFIVDKRLEKASSMLIDKQQSISEIASECGFNDLSHFSRYFKKKYNILPSKYRK